MKLFLKEYSINSYVFSKAIIGALIAAKSVAIMDTTPWLNLFARFPRYINVLYKTIIYTLAVVVIGIIENLIHAYRETKILSTAISTFLKSENIYSFTAVILCIAVVFLIYNIFEEIRIYLGKGTLSKLFFGKPSNSNVTH